MATVAADETPAPLEEASFLPLGVFMLAPENQAELAAATKLARTVYLVEVGSPADGRFPAITLLRPCAPTIPEAVMRQSHPLPSSAAAVVVAAIVALQFAAVGRAAPDAGAKARGQLNFYGSSAHNSFSSARNHVDNYQRYLSDTHGVPMPADISAGQPAVPTGQAAQIATYGAVDPDIAREASDAIADDIERIQRHVNRMLADAKGRGDEKTVAELADVDKQLGIARRGHAALHEHHAGETIAPATAMDLAQKVNAALRAAHAEHDEVMKRLGIPAAP